MSRLAIVLLLGLTLALPAALDAADQAQSKPKTKLIVSPKSLTFKSGTSQLSFSVARQRWNDPG